MPSHVMGRSSRLAAFAFAALLLAGCESSEERADRHYQRGLDFVAEEDFNRARIEFQNARRLEPDHTGALYQLARHFERNGRLGRAATFFRRVAEIETDNFETREAAARIYLAGGALDEARPLIDEAAALAPENPDILAIRAATLYRQGEREEGLEVARSALAIDPDHISANLVLISDLAVRERRSEALARIDELLGRVPEDSALNLFKLQLLSAAGDPEPLEAHLLKLTEIFPEEIGFRRALGQLYFSTGDLDAAEAQLRRIAELSPDDPDAAVAVAQFVLERRGLDAARDELDAMLGAGPSPEIALALQLAKSELERAAGRPEAARAILADIVESAASANDADAARIQMARLDLAEDDRESAGALIDTVLERDGDNAEALAVRARMQIDEDRSEEAILTLRRALDLEPENVLLLGLEAEAQQRNGNLALAAERLGAATRVAEFRPDIARRYAAFLRNAQNQPSAAENVLAETARRYPNDLATLSELAELRLALEDYVGADRVAQQLRRLQGGEAVADRVLAASLAGQGDIQQGLDVLERSVAETEGGDGALATLVAGYIRTGETGRAITLLDERLTQNPEDIRALVLRAEIDLLSGEMTAAEDRLRRTVEVAPELQVSHLVLARFLLSQERLDEALETAETGIERVEDNAALRLLVAGIYERRGAFDIAIQHYERLYESQPGSVVAANNLASLIAEFNEDDPEAIDRAARIARRLRGSDVPHFQDTYGWIAFLEEDMTTALSNLESAARGLPQNPLVRYHFGRALVAAGEIERGRSELETALSIDPLFSKADSARRALDTIDDVAQ